MNLVKPIEVFIRHCIFSELSDHKKRVEGFSKEKCWQNFLKTMNRDLANVTLFFDEYYPAKEPHFLEKHREDPIITIQAGCETKSFLYQLDYVLEKSYPEDTIIYFLEDDYLHKPKWCEALIEGFSLEPDYLTLYDHRDKYFFKEYENLSSCLYHTKHLHWRTTPSTTNTYAMRFSTLKEDAKIHRAFSENRRITADHEKFLALGQKGKKLISAMPGMATHCEPEYLSPCYNWERELELI